jgi:hypothetical protein
MTELCGGAAGDDGVRPTEGIPMFWFILLVLIVGGVVAWKFRVQLLSKVLGQPEHRIQRAIDRRKDGRG